jgi:RNA polymerase sigma factor for flagellar operon FliA
MNSKPSGTFAAQGHVCPDSIYRDLRRLAKRLCRRTSTHHLEDDLVQAGALGLIEASIRFDESRAVPFRAYAHRRIEGAMLDEIRAYMPLTRRAHESDDGRLRFDGPTMSEPPCGTPPADELLARGHDLFDLRCALQRLSEDEHAIIIAVYDFDEAGSSGAALARAEGVSRSSASRRHQSAVSRLRDLLGVEAVHG